MKGSDILWPPEKQKMWTKLVESDPPLFLAIANASEIETLPIERFSRLIWFLGADVEEALARRIVAYFASLEILYVFFVGPQAEALHDWLDLALQRQQRFAFTLYDDSSAYSDAIFSFCFLSDGLIACEGSSRCEARTAVAILDSSLSLDVRRRMISLLRDPSLTDDDSTD